MRRTSIVKLDQIREINLTPLIDLTFILLITFIITFPLIEQGIPVDLPRGRTRELDDRQSRTITVDREGNVFLDLTPVSLPDLEREMAALGSADPEAVIMVRGDQALAYGRIVEVLRLLQRANIVRMALVTQAED